MAHRRLWGVPTEQRRTLWARWKAGESIAEIARALDRTHGAVQTVVAREGGMAPAPRRRSRWALRASEREEITRGLAARASIRQIARTLHRAPSTISREIRRNGGRTHYRAARADAQAWGRARRPKPQCRLAATTRAAAGRRRGSPPGPLGAAANRRVARDGIPGRSHDASLA